MSIRYLTTLITLLLPGTVLARPIEQSRSLPKVAQLDVSGRTAPSFNSPRVFQAATAGTTFYGGTFWAADSQRWEAYENQLWTFDTGVGSSIVPPGGPQNLSAPTSSWINPFKQPGFHATMEGWIGFDQTFGEIPYFRRVGVNDPRWQAVKCVGSAAGLQGDYSFWAGVFPQEATALCYASGQGYGNAWHVCIEHAFNFPGGNVNLSFQCKNETEDGVDYTQVTCEPSGSGGVAEVISFTGSFSGAATVPLRPGIELPNFPTTIKIKFCVSSDGGWSDQDGLSPTTCGAFAVDNIVLSGAISHTANFETGDDGWTLSAPEAGRGGEWANLYDLDDLPPPLTTCPCALDDSVLAFSDASGHHNNYQNNLAASPWIDLKTYGNVGAPGRVLKTNLYTNLPLLNYLFTEFMAQWYPQVCANTGKLITSPWTSNGFVYYFGGISQCTSTLPGTLGTQIDFSSIIPPGAEQVRIAVGVFSYCRFFANCTQISNTSPWFDYVGLGVYGDANTALVFTLPTHRAQDSFPESGGIGFTQTARVDCNEIQGGVQTGSPTYLGDTLVVRCDATDAEVYVHFRVTPGGGTNMTTFNSWYSSHPASSIDPTFRRARCDTAELGGSGPLLGFWMTSYHELDPNFASHGANDRTKDPQDILYYVGGGGGNWRLSHDIFPDRLFTPGTRIDYFFSANKIGSSISGVDPVTAPAVSYEMEILPAVDPGSHTFNCVLYVDHADDTGQNLIEDGLLSVLGTAPGNFEQTKWDRYDVNAPSSNQASLGRPIQGDYGANAGQLLLAYRVILWDSGNLEADNLSEEDGKVLIPWLLTTGYDSNMLYLSGNSLVFDAVHNAENQPSPRRLVEDLAGVTLKTACAAGNYRLADCPETGAPQDLTSCVDLRPTPRAIVANSLARSVGHVAQGNGCPELRSFDVLEALTPDYGSTYPDEMYLSPVKSGRFASVATDARTTFTRTYKIMTDGVSLEYRRDEGTACDYAAGGRTAITERLAEVFNYFGVVHGVCPPRATTGIDEGGSPPPTLLSGFTPNPLMTGAMGRIRFSMAKDAPASIEILDLQGRLVKTVFDAPAKKGINEVIWDGRDASGAHIGNGVYFYRFRALDQDQSQKMVVVGGGR